MFIGIDVAYPEHKGFRRLWQAYMRKNINDAYHCSNVILTMGGDCTYVEARELEQIVMQQTSRERL